MEGGAGAGIVEGKGGTQEQNPSAGKDGGGDDSNTGSADGKAPTLMEGGAGAGIVEGKGGTQEQNPSTGKDAGAGGDVSNNGKAGVHVAQRPHAVEIKKEVERSASQSNRSSPVELAALNRLNTTELQSASSVAGSDVATASEQQEDEEEDEQETDDAAALQAEKVRLQKEAHARYMRFSRSLRSGSPDIQSAGMLWPRSEDANRDQACWPRSAPPARQAADLDGAVDWLPGSVEGKRVPSPGAPREVPAEVWS